MALQVVEPGPSIGTSGQIAKVRLENFMCHDNLEVTFTYVVPNKLVLQRHYMLQLASHLLS